jgi:hypothetical protein
MSRHPQRYIVVFALLALGCSPSVNQQWAKEVYQRQSEPLKAFETELLDHYKRFAPARLYLADGDRATLQREHNERAQAFEQAISKMLEARPEIVGYTFSYTVPKLDKEPIHYGIGGLSNRVPSFKVGSTIRTDKSKLKVDDRSLGWGFYQIPGKETELVLGLFERKLFHTGIELISTIEAEDTKLHYSLFILDPAPDQSK